METQAASSVNTSQADPKASAPQDPQQNQTSTGANVGINQGSIKEAAAEARRKIKIDDQEVDEDEVLKVYKDRKGHQRAANKELQEGRAAKKQAEAFIQAMKDKGSLFDAIKRLGHDPRKLAEEYLASQLEEDLLDPREKELREYKAKLQQYEAQEKKKQEEEAKQRDDELKAKYTETYTKQFTEALSESGLPANKETVAEMAKYISRAAKINFEMTPKEAAQLVKDDMETRLRNIYGNADAEALIRLLGDQNLQKIRTYDVAKLKDPNANLKTPENQEPKDRPRRSTERMTPQQWREFNRK